jgi:hypothetical protein
LLPPLKPPWPLDMLRQKAPLLSLVRLLSVGLVLQVHDHHRQDHREPATKQASPWRPRRINCPENAQRP